MTWLLWMKRWARRPPGPAAVAVVLAILAVCAGLVVIERTVGWPDALTTHRFGRGGVR